MVWVGVVGEVPGKQERIGPHRKVSPIPVRTLRCDRYVFDFALSCVIRSQAKILPLLCQPANDARRDTPFPALPLVVYPNTRKSFGNPPDASGRWLELRREIVRLSRIVDQSEQYVSRIIVFFSIYRGSGRGGGRGGVGDPFVLKVKCPLDRGIREVCTLRSFA